MSGKTIKELFEVKEAEAKSKKLAALAEWKVAAKIRFFKKHDEIMQNRGERLKKLIEETNMELKYSRELYENELKEIEAEIKLVSTF